jgi:hypothetical protein
LQPSGWRAVTRIKRQVWVFAEHQIVNPVTAGIHSSASKRREEWALASARTTESPPDGNDRCPARRAGMHQRNRESGGIKMRNTISIVVVILLFSLSANAAPGFTAKLSDDIGFTKLVNEVSFYRNTDNEFNERGFTLQIISINSFRFFTDFNFEFTGDFNWELDLYEEYDYYLELSVVKPVYKMLSVNYQQIHGSFVSGTIHQFGVRLSL